MNTKHQDLARQALSNLVNQFAQPLDFLRELVQNAIDAGSARIEVSVSYDPPRPGATEGVARIAVDDWGEGMDEAIIDGQLTRLFSSSKEDDLTKIGKFGIGFTSIFAIQPEAVLLRTGRHGENWQLLFHADRSYEKERIDEPIDGTKITLYKRLAPADLPALIDDSRRILTYWCEHSDTPITFHDRTQAEPEPEVGSADPFAAFAERPVALRSTISRPLDLADTPLSIHTHDQGMEILAGYSTHQPRFGFYNGGLTLLITSDPEALGDFAPSLRHLSFKVKYDQLEHTLTRDNILQDENHADAMRGVLRAREALWAPLLKRAEDVATQKLSPGDEGFIPLPQLHGWLAAECRILSDRRDALRHRPIFVDDLGRPLTLAEIERQEQDVGSVLLADGPSPLHDALHALDVRLVADAPQTRELLFVTHERPLLSWLGGERALESAEEVFIMAAPVPRAALAPAERRLLNATRTLLGAAVGLRVRIPNTERVLALAPSDGSPINRLRVVVGDFPTSDGPDEILALNGPRDGRVFQRSPKRRIRLPAFLHWRTLLVNRTHPVFRAHLLAEGEDLQLAALGLAQALLHAEGRETERAYRRMIDAFTDTMELR